MEKTIIFTDESGNGVPNVTIISDVNGSQTSGADGSVSFRDGKQTFTPDENTGTPSQIAKVETNFMFKSLS